MGRGKLLHPLVFCLSCCNAPSGSMPMRLLVVCLHSIRNRSLLRLAESCSNAFSNCWI